MASFEVVFAADYFGLSDLKVVSCFWRRNRERILDWADSMMKRFFWRVLGFLGDG